MFVKKLMAVAFIVIMVSACASMNAQKILVEAGSKAPEFVLPDQNGTDVTLSEILANYRGAVIAFYPKDDSRN